MDCGTLENVPPGTTHLDTVRALHQTVVSLRTALEVSKNELKELKEKYQQHSNCIAYTDVIEKLSIENHILRRKIIDSGYEDKNASANIKLQLTYSPQDTGDSGSGVGIRSATDLYSGKSPIDVYSAKTISESNVNHDLITAKCIDNLNDHTDSISDKTDSVDTINKTEVEDSSDAQEKNQFCTTLNVNKIEELPESSQSSSSDQISPKNDITEIEASYIEESFREATKNSNNQFKTKLELLSKFDVKIKVRTLREGDKESTSSDSDSTTIKSEADNKEPKDTSVNLNFEETREHFENIKDSDNNKIHVRAVSTDKLKMAVPSEVDNKVKSDKFDLQVRITSEESLVVKEKIERSRRKDTLNLDVDNVSLRSMSEGDNSVFSEGVVTPMEPSVPEDGEQDNPSDNESEEVDDIELIFTTDESKDMTNFNQEDLVSIGDTEHWHSTSASSHSTPVLIKFHTLDPDFQPRSVGKDNVQNENQEKSSLQNIMAESLRAKRVSLPSDKEIRQTLKSKDSLDLPGRGILKTNKSDNMLYKRSPNASTRNVTSVDSLTYEYNRGLSFDNTKSSSFELGSSMDILHRDESVDSFRRSPMGGHRFSVFAETDISKCGISEDDLSSNLNVRRNTCPNPFQYRPIYRAGRATGPVKVTSSHRPRPVLRDSVTARRESGAQTDVSALPDRWTSDGYLAYKTSAPPIAVPPTLPQRVCPPVMTSRRLTVPDARPPERRSDETRRVLLSDYGFTSMVPELSRSADPLWTLKQAEASPTPTTASKFFSRNSSYRSPCVSIDRSYDWTPQAVYIPHSKVDYRAWRSSLPDVRGEDTDQLMEECDTFLRRSTDNLRSMSLDLEDSLSQLGQPYIPAEPKHLRLGHVVKIISPQGRIAVGRVRYVGIAGGTAATSSFVVGAEFSHSQYPGLPRNDGTFQGRRYFLTPPNYTALFVPFSKVVMAWAN